MRAANTLYITPDGEGDGSSWDNAAALDDLAELIAQIEPGGEILVAADRGDVRRAPSRSRWIRAAGPPTKLDSRRQ